MAKAARSPNVLSLKVTLLGIRPPIWRRVLMPGTWTLGDLHMTIQMAMGWEGGHLHAFDINGRHYGDREIMDDVDDENRLTLNGVKRDGISRFAYVYDFGDNWQHSVLLEQRVPAVASKAYPICVAGRRSCPPEDCGGVWGYLHLLEVLADPSHPEHAEQVEWLGEEFDPEEFDPDIVNEIFRGDIRQA